MNVSLTPQLEELIKRKVASGMYGNASEVVREALRMLEERDRYQELRAEVGIGFEQIERGDTMPLNMEAIKRDAREASRQGHKVNPVVIPEA
jgi:antitoxin ParD1/3/4